MPRRNEKPKKSPTDLVTVKLPSRVHKRVKRWGVDLGLTIPEVIDRAMDCLEQQYRTRGEEE